MPQSDQTVYNILQKEVEVLNEIALGITGKTKIDDFVQSIIEKALSYTEVDVIGLGLINQETNKIDGHWATGIPYEAVRKFGIGLIDLNDTWEISVIAICEKKFQICEDASNDPRVTKAVVELTGTKSFVIFPLIVKEESIGFIGFEHRKKPIKFDANDLSKYQRFVNSLALFFHNYKIYAELDNLNQNLEHLVEIKVSELKQAHDTIWNIKEHLAAIIENTVNGIIATDPYGGIVVLNKAAKELFGCNLGNIHENRISSLFRPEDQKLYFPERIPFFLFDARSIARNLETEMISPDGSPVQVNLSVVKMFDRNQIHAGFLFILQDLREIRLLEAKVIQAEKLKLFGEMAAGITHELNSPFGMIKGANTLLKKILPDNNVLATKYFNIIDEAIERGVQFLREMLNFSKPNQTSLEYLDVGKTLQQAVEIIQLKVLNTEVLWRINICEQMPQIRGNSGKLLQVWLNLLDNAVFAMNKNGEISVETYLEKAITEEITARELPPRRKEDSIEREFFLFRKTKMEIPNKLPSHILPGDLLITVKISDTGSGIPPENLSKIFDLFFTSRKNQSGTGLGLSISQSIIREHQGAIFVASELGKGTTFSIKLPVISEYSKK
ncbi:MAG: PAS domain-containing protein [Candidatus Riflebacteria bacterium]|nr:PAS domain-containing protein [Candidatus Riflebacteria bacterium]